MVALNEFGAVARASRPHASSSKTFPAFLLSSLKIRKAGKIIPSRTLPQSSLLSHALLPQW
jgi:hypothetical protein